MKALFDSLSVEVSKLTTRTYSTSFTLGIYMLSPRLRDSIYSVYGFVRLADEIVDSFGGYDRAYLLEKFKQETYESLNTGISLNPILNSFQAVVRKNEIDLNLIDTFLESMEMDLAPVEYTPETYNKYILGSAEVVGLMCLQIFTEGDKARYEELKPYAMKLGAAFQKVNFLRDMGDDYQLLGRKYFPNMDIENFTGDAKAEIEAEIEQDFQAALLGIRKLPATCRGGVYLAYAYYRSLFNKIRSLPPRRVISERIRINNSKKLGLMLNCMVLNKMRWV